MKQLLEALNRPANAFRNERIGISWSLVMITVLINAVVEPILQFFAQNGQSSINGIQMIKVMGFSLTTYLLICFALWLVCKCFGSKLSFISHFKTWGLTYFPTLCCGIVVAVTESYAHLFWNNIGLGLLLNLVFFGILFWKAILFFIYLREYAEIKGWKFFATCVVMGVIILALMAFDGYLGVKTPVL